jgi:ribonuclease BN (tRNA processing enzyme)
VKLTVVGCSGSFPGPDSAASCYLVEHAGSTIVVDLGNGALGALQQYISLDDVDAVLISHLHVDHVIDLCSFYVARAYRPAGALPPLRVVGPSGTQDQLARAYGTTPEHLGAVFVFETHAPVYEVG